jgi:hypothetical protein
VRKLLVPAFTLFAALTLFDSNASAENPGAETIVLKKIEGDVKIVRQGQAVAAEAGGLLRPGDQLLTGEKASAEIAVGEWGRVNLGEKTTWSIETYSEKESVDFSSQLALGHLKAKLKKLPRGSSFQVQTPTAVAAVRGTFFGLWVYDLNGLLRTLLKVYDDTVHFSNSRGDQGYDVGEGESSTADENGKVTPPGEEEGGPEEESETINEELLGIPGLSEEGENADEEPQEPEEEEESDQRDFGKGQ